LVRADALFSCKTCHNRGRKGPGEFNFDDVDLECLGEFTYLGDVLNDGAGVERAVVGRARAAWTKFRELNGLLCTRETSFKMTGVLYRAYVRSVLMCGA